MLQPAGLLGKPAPQLVEGLTVRRDDQTRFEARAQIIDVGQMEGGLLSLRAEMKYTHRPP
jgi:hypothetical protein